MTATLMILSGPPGVGKTTLARHIAARTGAVHLRIDTIEAAMTRSGIVAAAGGWDAYPESGYHVSYAIAEDLLRAGHTVVADCVNPIPQTRQAWLAVAEAAVARSLTVEVICSDATVHRSQVQNRVPDLPGLILPTWQEVLDQHYVPWQDAAITVDTLSGIDCAVDQITRSLVGESS